MPVNGYIDTMKDGNGNIYYPKTKESAIEDDNGVSLSNKLSSISFVIDCTCTYSEPDNTYILEPTVLSIDIPQIFTVRFKAPNSYVKNATFTLRDEIYNALLSSGGNVENGAFASGSIVVLEFYKDNI